MNLARDSSAPMLTVADALSLVGCWKRGSMKVFDFGRGRVSPSGAALLGDDEVLPLARLLDDVRVRTGEDFSIRDLEGRRDAAGRTPCSAAYSEGEVRTRGRRT